jgi:N-acetylmuramoyl-L-alanine amidase
MILALGLASTCPASADPLKNIKTVIIDAGHGANDFGAKNPNIIIEKDFTRKIALTLKKLVISKNGKSVKVVLTRSGKRGAGQEERAFTANKNRGDLYISVHAASGFDQTSRDLGIFIMPNRRGISWKETNARHSIENEKFAGYMMESLNGFYRHKKFVIRKGEFIPLFGINMPALLIEVSALNDPRDELYISRKGFYRNISTAIYTALINYDGTYGKTYGNDGTAGTDEE